MKVCQDISVLIRTFNSAKTLQTVIQRLGLSVQDELIIVDSGSGDTTLAIAQQHAARILSVGGRFNYSKALNVGFEAARNPWVLVLSSHCLPTSSQHLERFRRGIAKFPESVVVAYGPCLLTAANSDRGKAADVLYLRGPEWKGKRPPGGNGNALYRLDYWRRHKFDETLPTAEDLEWFLWAMRSGYTAADLPAASVLYRNQAGLRQMFAKGLAESKAARDMLGLGKTSLAQLCIGLGSLGKNLLLGRIPFGTLLREAARQCGGFMQSRNAPNNAPTVLGS